MSLIFSKFNNMEPTYTQNQNIGLSGGLQLGTVSFLHIIDQPTAIRAGFIILLIWFGFRLALEFVKYLMAR